MEALNQIHEMLSTVDEKFANSSDDPVMLTRPVVTSTTLLNSVHLQFLVGCFGLGAISSESAANAQLYHYQVRP